MVFSYLFVHWAWRNAASVPKLIMMKIRFGIPTRQTMRVKVVLFDELMLHIHRRIKYLNPSLQGE